MSTTGSRLQEIAAAKAPVAKPAFRFWRVTGAIVVLWGCIGGYVSVYQPLRARLTLHSQMQTVANLYLDFQQRLGRSPRDLEELEEYQNILTSGDARRQLPSSTMQTTTRASNFRVDGPIEIAIEAIQAGDLHMIWNANCTTYSGGRLEFLGHEVETSRTGGFVILVNGDVVRMESTEFVTLTPAPAANPPSGGHRLKKRPSKQSLPATRG